MDWTANFTATCPECGVTTVYEKGERTDAQCSHEQSAVAIEGGCDD